MFKEIEYKEIQENLEEKLKNDWALVTAGSPDDFNMMTISWGAFGTLWNDDMATIYIRESRHTINYLEKEDYFTISFYGKEYRKALGICGSKSGKDTNKLEMIGFSPLYDKAPYFEEANIVLVCRKVAKTDFKNSVIYDENIVQDNYKDGDFHIMYNGIIEKVLIK